MQEFSVPPNTGRAWEMRAGQVLRVSGTTIADFVLFNCHDLQERFDQARTKSNQGKVFISVGDWLYSKRNNRMMQIVEDGFDDGHHDLQEGMCSRRRWEVTAQYGDLSATYGRPTTLADLPDHGCWENLSRALAPHGIDPDDIPSPFNLFQTMEIDGATGRLSHSRIRPRPGTWIGLRAEGDCLCAISACPDPIVGGRELLVQVVGA